jgi:type II secretory pathway component PulF
VRFRTAAILTVVLIGGMFGLPAAVLAVFPLSLNEGLPNPVPGYEQILLSTTDFCGRFRWVLALPIVVVLFTVAAFTNPSRIAN